MGKKLERSGWLRSAKHTGSLFRVVKLCLQRKGTGNVPSCTVSLWPFCQEVFVIFPVAQDANTGLTAGCPLQGHLSLLPDLPAASTHSLSFFKSSPCKKGVSSSAGTAMRGANLRGSALPLFLLETIPGWQDPSTAVSFKGSRRWCSPHNAGVQ